MRFIFIRLAVVGFSMCEIPRHCERIRSYSRSRHPRSSILVSVESAHALFLLFISNVWRICYRFEILTFKAYTCKMACFPTPLLLVAPAHAERVRISGWNLPRKNYRVMELLYAENFRILTSTVFDWSTRVTDGRTGDIARQLHRALKSEQDNHCSWLPVPTNQSIKTHLYSAMSQANQRLIRNNPVAVA